MAKKISIYKVGEKFFSAENKKEIASFLDISESKIQVINEEINEEVINVTFELLIKRQIQEHLNCLSLIQKKDVTRSFNIGEEVEIGSLYGYIVVENLNNQVYVIQKPNDRKSAVVCSWYQLYKKQEEVGDIFCENYLKLNFSNTTINSLFIKYYHFGVDMNPVYQRDLVWTLEQKRDLIGSIECGIDIGRFVFVHKNYKYGESDYEILDGKQRLSALIDFYEDRFSYKGRYFSELSKQDRRRITDSGVLVAELKNGNEQEIVNCFVKLNSTGKPVEESFLNQLKEKYNLD